MKLFLIVAAILVSSGISNAQSSGLAGKTFVFIMKDASGNGEEVKEKMTFTGTSVNSQSLGAYGFTVQSYTETALPNGAGFNFTATGPAGTRVYEGIVEQDWISGSIQVTDKAGAQSTMYFRGATQNRWNSVSGTSETSVSE